MQECILRELLWLLFVVVWWGTLPVVSAVGMHCMGDVRCKNCLWHTKQEHLSFVYKRNGINHVQNLNLILIVTENVLNFCTTLMDFQQVHLITAFNIKKMTPSAEGGKTVEFTGSHSTHREQANSERRSSVWFESLYSCGKHFNCAWDCEEQFAPCNML